MLSVVKTKEVILKMEIKIDITNIINNIMGYWRYPIKTTSLQQSLIAQLALEDRSQNTGLFIAKP
jgi:hypothetical protein